MWSRSVPVLGLWQLLPPSEQSLYTLEVLLLLVPIVCKDEVVGQKHPTPCGPWSNMLMLGLGCIQQHKLKTQITGRKSAESYQASYMALWDLLRSHSLPNCSSSLCDTAEACPEICEGSACNGSLGHIFDILFLRNIQHDPLQQMMSLMAKLIAPGSRPRWGSCNQLWKWPMG